MGYMPIFINIGKTIMALNISTSEFDTSLGNEKGITKKCYTDDKSVTLIQTIKETLSDGSVRFCVKFTLADADKIFTSIGICFKGADKKYNHIFLFRTNHHEGGYALPSGPCSGIVIIVPNPSCSDIILPI